MPKISACIISYNEEAKIADCLESVEGVADEIVVVDSLSTDRTPDIARLFTDRVFDQEFLGHVQQKSLAVEKASHDWILSLDCDERLSPGLRDAILAQKDALDHHDAWRFARRTFYIYRWLNHCWYPDWKVRLFNRETCHWGGVNPHDHVEVPSGDVGTLQGDLLHYSFDSVSDHLKTIDTFTEIAANEFVERGRRASIWDPWTHGCWTFIKCYIFKRGFLDGFAGLLASTLSFVHAFVKYSKVLVRQKMKTPEQS